MFEVAPDYESYEFTPLDLEKDKEFILGCWAWTNECDGLKYADGKVRISSFLRLSINIGEERRSLRSSHESRSSSERSDIEAS